ncbi:MAG: D-glucuronyl C5-epimerase family protein [Chitinophagaceae bacterium]|nr:D-glucuronyl C5-epimerase family protein [Chitinophagaceae bacterium]
MVKLARRQWLPILLALLTAAGLGQWRGDAWEEPLRQVLFRLRGDSVPSFATDFVDAAGIPYVYYAQQNGIAPGYQYNATIVCNYALAYADSLRSQPADTALRGKLQRCVQWLQQQLAGQGDTAIFYFYWQQPWYPQVGVPYTSGMTSGLAMQVLARADSLLGLPDAALTCRRLLRGFFVPRQQGGFTLPQPQGWWYEELARACMPPATCYRPIAPLLYGTMGWQP